MTQLTKKEVLSRINSRNNGFVEDNYPFGYAHNFIVSYPETVPETIQKELAQNSLITTQARTARVALDLWAKDSGLEKEELAKVLADAWLDKHHLS